MPPKSREERLFGASCLRVTLERRLGEDGAAESEIYQASIHDLGLSDAEVLEYLKTHREVVEHALARKGKNGG